MTADLTRDTITVHLSAVGTHAIATVLFKIVGLHVMGTRRFKVLESHILATAPFKYRYVLLSSILVDGTHK